MAIKKLSFDRTDVLEKLWSRAKWLEAKIDNQRTKLSPNLKASKNNRYEGKAR